VRVRDHLALSTAGAALLYPWFGQRVVSGWAASILIDVDHYLWFVTRKRSVNPIAAVRYFNKPQPPHSSNVRLFHKPLVLLVVGMLSTRWRALLPVALGMTAHVAMDAYHDERLKQAHAAALLRDKFTCQVCGTRDDSVTAHLKQQPALLPSYATANLITLCGSCHEDAHAGRAPSSRVRVQIRRRI